MSGRNGFAMGGVVAACIIIPILVLSGMKVVSMLHRGTEMTQRQETTRAMARVKAQIVSAAADADADGFFELPAPSAEGGVPVSIPGSTADGYGEDLLYCVWDLGSENTVDAGYASGTVVPPVAGLAGRLVSSGRDKVSQSDCVTISGDDAYVDIFEADVRMGTGGLGGFSDDGTDVTLITPSDKVALGGETAQAKLHVTVTDDTDGILLEDIHGQGDQSRPYVGVIRYGEGKSRLTLSRTSRTKGDPGATGAGDIGDVAFYGHDGTTFFEAAYLKATLASTPTASDKATELSACVAGTGAAGNDLSDCLFIGGGGIGVGKQSPAVSLDVAGDVAARGGNVYFARDDAGSTHSLIGLSGNDFVFQSGVSTPSSTPSAGIRVADAYVAGNLGVGTSTTGAYSLYVNGSAYATGVWQSSDRRLKTGITPLGKRSSGVLGLTPVSFDYRSDIPGRKFPAKRQIGLVAQDVEKVFPELVDTDPDGYKVVAYDKLAVLLLGVVRDQDKRISDLERRLDRLERSK